MSEYAYAGSQDSFCPFRFGSSHGIVMIASVKKLLIKRADRPEIHEPEQGFDVCHGKDTLEDKMKKLIRKDVESGNF